MKEDGDMEKIMMARGARTVVETCLRVQPDENVVIVAELSKLSIARSIANAVFAANANPMVITMLPRQRDGQEPPLPVAAAMATSDAFVCCVVMKRLALRSLPHGHHLKQKRPPLF